METSEKINKIQILEGRRCAYAREILIYIGVSVYCCYIPYWFSNSASADELKLDIIRQLKNIFISFERDLEQRII